MPDSPFSIDTATALPGPDWLRARRRDGAARFAAADLPSPDEEVWRYSRIGELDLGAYSAPVAREGDDDGVGVPATVAAFVDGLHLAATVGACVVVVAAFIVKRYLPSDRDDPDITGARIIPVDADASGVQALREPHVRER